MNHINCGIDWSLLCFYRYQKAIVIYEEIARQSINNNLLKYGVRGHLLNAGLCQLCRGDIVAITNALERYQVHLLFLCLIFFFPTVLAYDLIIYIFISIPSIVQDLDPTFSRTREYKFLAVSSVFLCKSNVSSLKLLIKQLLPWCCIWFIIADHSFLLIPYCLMNQSAVHMSGCGCHSWWGRYC